MRTNKLHFFLLLLMCFCLNFSVQAEASIHIIKGKVTCEGKGIQGIMVTDGRICVQTDASGKYNIPTLGDSRFVYICTPSGYLTDRKGTIPSFYLPIDHSKKQNYNFNLKKRIRKVMSLMSLLLNLTYRLLPEMNWLFISM